MIKYDDFYCEEIISGKTPVKKLYESDNVLAFHHTQPSYRTHIVVVCKKHIVDLASFTDLELGILLEIMTVTRKLSKKLNKKSGIRVVINSGKFQDNPHFHLHLVTGQKLKTKK